MKQREIWIQDPDQAIHMSEFAEVFPLWGDYCLKVIPRRRIADVTMKSTYIISLMKWMETSSKPK